MTQSKMKESNKKCGWQEEDSSLCLGGLLMKMFGRDFWPYMI